MFCQTKQPYFLLPFYSNALKMDLTQIKFGTDLYCVNFTLLCSIWNDALICFTICQRTFELAKVKNVTEIELPLAKKKKWLTYKFWERKTTKMEWNETREKTDASKWILNMLSLTVQFDFQFLYISCSSLRIGDGTLSYSISIWININAFTL